MYDENKPLKECKAHKIETRQTTIACTLLKKYYFKELNVAEMVLLSD